LAIVVAAVLVPISRLVRGLLACLRLFLLHAVSDSDLYGNRGRRGLFRKLFLNVSVFHSSLRRAKLAALLLVVAPAQQRPCRAPDKAST